uniref:DDE_3 domain-containing protein n=1 Tax=Heterorhabditis bacteriophora TaxID=37862 RepID=A0A1I7WBC0_HETBA
MRNSFRHTVNKNSDDTVFYFALRFASGRLEVFDGLKLRIIGIIPTYETCPEILHRIQIQRARRPVQSIHVTVLQPNLGASICVDGDIILLESEMSKGKNITPNQRNRRARKWTGTFSYHLNPIEHLWNDVEQEVQRQKPSNIRELEKTWY